MENKNKFYKNSKYFTIATYAVLACIIVAVALKVLFFWGEASSFVGSFLSTVSPFLIGILIAFLMNPLINWLKNTVFGKWIKVKNGAVNKILSIIFAYVIVLIALLLIIAFLIPSLAASITKLSQQAAGWYDQLSNFLKDLYQNQNNNKIVKFILEQLEAQKDTIMGFIKNFLPSLASSLMGAGMGVATAVVNIFIALIISVYLIVDKNMQMRSFKRIAYAFLEERKAKKLGYVVKKSITIFSEFFDGKMIDSLIMGVITFVFMIIGGLCGLKGYYENAVLIAVIVGITNMIPYFGPFIGVVPSFIILFAFSPLGAVIFAIGNIILMQIDGNFIGPKILGESVGLRPLWIIFAILIGGWVGGFVGILIGVPCVATITTLLNESVDVRLDKKNLDIPRLENEKVVDDEKKAAKKAARKARRHKK